MISFNFSRKKFVLIIIACIFHGIISCREKITGDVHVRDGVTFSFAAKAYCAPRTHRVYIGAQEAEKAKDFALCFLNQGENHFSPFAPQKIKMNTVEQANPIYNAAIAHLREIDVLNLAVVLAHEPEDLYVINSGAMGSFQLFSTKSILDSAYHKNAGIIACESFFGKDNRIIFAALKGNGQSHFGDGDSGIALVSFDQTIKKVEVTEKEIEEIKKSLKGASEEKIEETLKNIKTEDGKKIRDTEIKSVKHLRTIPFSKKSDFLKIGNDLVHMNDIIDMHWSPFLERLYIALRVKGGEHEADGARAIAVGHFNAETQQLTFNPIVGTAPLARNADHIVARMGADVYISIHKVRTMQTTTGFLNYLIVVGGNGDSHQTQRTVYALPLLHFQDEKKQINPELMGLHGTLASICQTKELFRANAKSPSFLGRYFCTVPKNFHDLYTNESSAAQVGAGPLLAGPINDIYVKDDAVYALVTEACNNYESGVYYSQAIFEKDGTIIAWTTWQKALDHDDWVNEVVLDSAHGAHLVMSGTTPDSVRTVERMGWETEFGFLSHVARVLTAHFPQHNGGIHELVDFPVMAPGLSRDSLLCATGFERLALAQMNKESTTAECIVFKNGAIDTAIDPIMNIVAFEGGDLAGLGAINAAEIGINAHTGWLFVGGVHGLAVLCNPDGSGWKMPHNVGCTFNGLQEGMRFKKIGAYQFVRKIIYDSENLYVLTDTALDRIDLRTVDFSQPDLPTRRLANAHEIISGPFALFHDMIISEKLCVLAHNAGLSRSGNHTDIRLDDATRLNWTCIPIPAAQGPAIALFPVTVSGRTQDCARAAAGQLYVISGLIGKNKAQVNRFVIHNCVDFPVSDSTIEPLHDYALKDKLAPLSRLAAYSGLFMTDGGTFFSGIDRKKTKPPILMTGFGRAASAVPLKLDSAHQISRVLRSSTFGSWLVAGDFGLLVNE